jgi:hypothetical protein
LGNAFVTFEVGVDVPFCPGPKVNPGVMLILLFSIMAVAIDPSRTKATIAIKIADFLYIFFTSLPYLSLLSAIIIEGGGR